MHLLGIKPTNESFFSIANEIHIYLLSAPKSEAYRCSLVII